MNIRQKPYSQHWATGLVISIAATITFGGVFEARAQVNDFNLQTRLQQFNATPLVPPTVEAPPGSLDSSSLGCSTDADLVISLLKRPAQGVPRLYPNELTPYMQHLIHGYKLTDLENELKTNKTLTPDIAEILKKKFKKRTKPQDNHADKKATAKRYALPPAPPVVCPDKKTGKITQPTTVKVSLPFNSTYETNALKSNQNASSGTTLGLGGTLQVTTGGFGDFDVMALSVGSTSIRYGQFPTKSLDAVTTQGAYQWLIHAYDGSGGDVVVGEKLAKDKVTGKDKDVPAPGLITFDTATLGFQNQTAYMPTFRLETSDLFTPQFTLSRQNWSLFGNDPSNQCWVASKDPRKDGFCHYIDLSLTAGQTFSDVTAQQNANLAVSATPGWRIDGWDWKITLPATATARYYENFPGGRQDLLLQIGPAFTYTPDPIKTSAIDAALQFSVSATYNQNFSTVSAASWHGFVVLPTLTIAFQPAK